LLAANAKGRDREPKKNPRGSLHGGDDFGLEGKA